MAELENVVEGGRLAASHYLRAAYTEAMKSPDPSTQNGAVLVYRNRIIGRGHNRFAQGVATTPERLADRDQKYPRTVHAERAAIYDAISHGFGYDVPFATLYTCWFACEQCAQTIIETGITSVVGHREHPGVANPGDRWHKYVELGLEMLDEAKVKCSYYSGPIGGVAVRFDGGVFEP